jgi:hypothetical protein
VKSGYETAVLSAREKLINLPPEKVCSICGVKFDGRKYIVKWCGKEYDVFSDRPADYNTALEILFLHYLTSEGTKKPGNNLIAFRELKGALFYEPKFIERAVRPLVKTFGKEPHKLIETGEKLGGIKSSAGNFAVKIDLLPNIPATYIIYADDGEFPPDGAVLFDKTASGWLPCEDLVVAGSFGAYELIKNFK